MSNIFSRSKSRAREIECRLVSLLLVVLFTTTEVWTQMAAVRVPTPEAENAAAASGEFWWFYPVLIALTLALSGAVFWWYSNRKSAKQVIMVRKKTYSPRKSLEGKSLDANKEMDWLRKNHKIMGAKSTSKLPVKTKTANLPVPGKTLLNANEKDSMPLPIFSVDKLMPARPFEKLPLSNDSALLSAIEQTQDEFEEDEAVRELAVRILTAFKNRNSVEALSQVALYDLSSNLRSKAVTILTEFDHESVFSTILLACADPTREVRAAAARGLTRLSCDRADAWTRIMETEEEGRMVQAARAVMEGDMVKSFFSRLVHSDRNFAYEGFTLFALLIKANETEVIFKALENHEDMNVRRAILHVIKVTKNQKALEGLYSLLERNTLPIELQEEVDKTIEEIGFVTI